MYSLSCASMGMESCTFVGKGETQEDVMSQVLEHVKTAHPEKMEGMDDAKMAGMKEMMMSKMVSE